MDDNGAPQQPTPAPTPPPAASPTPPPPATGSPTGDAQYRPGAPAVGQPAPYGQPASSKKGPTALILIIVAVVVLLCALAMCGVGAFVLLDSSPDAEESIEQADAYYGSATSKVEELNTYYSEDFASIEGDGGEAQAEAILEEVRGLVAAARDDLAECTGYIAPLEESTFKTQYLDAIALLNQSVDTYEQLYEFMPAENALQAELDAMTDRAERC